MLGTQRGIWQVRNYRINVRNGLLPNTALKVGGPSAKIQFLHTGVLISIDPDRPVQPNAWSVQDAMLSSLTTFSSTRFATHCRLKSGLKLGKDRPARHGRSQVHASELGHECLPHSPAAFLKKLGANRQLPRCRSEPASPCAHVDQQGNKLNRRFRETVNRLLFVGWVVGARQQTGLN